MAETAPGGGPTQVDHAYEQHYARGGGNLGTPDDMERVPVHVVAGPTADRAAQQGEANRALFEQQIHLTPHPTEIVARPDNNMPK